MSDITDYPSEVESQPSESGFTLKVRPVSESGQPLRGAMLKYLSPKDLSTQVGTFGGDQLPEFEAWGGDAPRGYVKAFHYGRETADLLLTGEDSSQTGSSEYTVDIVGGESNAPEQFSDVDDVAFIGNEVIATWRPLRHKESDGYVVCAVLWDGSEIERPGALFAVGEDTFESKFDPVVRRPRDHDFSITSASGGGHDGWKHVTAIEGADTASMTAAAGGDHPYARLPRMRDLFSNQTSVWARTTKAIPNVDNSSAETLPAYSTPNYDSGSNVTGVSISPDPGTVVEGDAYILTANVSGDGDHDPTVTWSSSGPRVITSDGTQCLIVAGRDGDVTAESNADSSVSASITINAEEYPADTTPSAPSNLSVRDLSPSGAVEISWDEEAGPLSFYRLYLSKDDPSGSPVKDVFRDHAVLSGLSPGTQYEVGVAAVHPDGNESSMETVSFSPAYDEGQKSGHRVRAPKEQVLSPGDSRTVDLTSLVYLTGNDSQSNLWSSASVRVKRADSSSPVSVSVNGTDLDVSMGGGAAQDYGPEPVLARIDRMGRVPVWIGFMVRAGSSTGTGPAQITDISPGALSAFDAEAVVGTSPEAHGLGAWGPELEKSAHLAGIEVSSGEVQVDPGEGPGPAIAALSGDDGASLVVVNRDAGVTVPQLPQDEVEKYEKSSGSWEDFSLSSIGQESSPVRWRRALTTGGDLYDVSVMEPPSGVRRQAPTYYRHFWLDEDQFPSDAELDPDQGKVVYRGGLKSPSGSPTEPDVTDLTLTPVPGGISASWDLELGGDPAGDLTVPVEYWPQGSPDQNETQSGQGAVEIIDLDPAQTYVVDLFGTQKTESPSRLPPSVYVVGYATSGGEYRYEYEVTANDLQSWTDHFGGTHGPGSAEVTSAEAVSEHKISLTWSTETREVSQATEWELPPGPVSFEKEAETGSVLLSESTARATFRNARYNGSREKTLHYRVYPAGAWEVHPVGYLPLNVDGELEDFVEAVFVGPGGEEKGGSMQIDEPTEMAVRVSVEAAEELSPTVYGVNVHPSS